MNAGPRVPGRDVGTGSLGSSTPVHEVAVRALADHSVAHVFGAFGDVNLFMVDRFERAAKGRSASVLTSSRYRNSADAN